MNFIERVMRAMAHIPIGAAVGLVAGALGFALQLVCGYTAPVDRTADVQAIVGLANAGPALRMELVPVLEQGGAPRPCPASRPATQPLDGALTGDDL